MPPLSERKQFYSPAPVLATAPFPRLQKERGEHINDGRTQTGGERCGRTGVRRKIPVRKSQDAERRLKEKKHEGLGRGIWHGGAVKVSERGKTGV